jgi:glyoxylase-like metal-dependent hydrolase (beta-lactamase superfamily II)
MPGRRTLRWLAPALLPLLVSCASVAPDAVVRRATDAMGGAKLDTLRYVAEGTGYTFGQAFVPGTAWPRITVHSQIRTINYATGAMREEITLSRGEPRGGGGYPLSGQQRNDQYVSGAFAWNQVGPAPVPGPRFSADRVHQLWITPHGVLKAAARYPATAEARTVDGKPVTAVTFTEPGRFVATAFIGASGTVDRVESRAPDAVLGEVDTVTTYSDYRDHGGVKFPARIQQAMGGFPVLDVTVKEVTPNAPADFPVPDLVRTAAERVTADKVADGVWYIAGGSHHSVAIEMSDHVIVVEAPLNDARTGAMLAQVRQLVPTKPIRYLVNSHGHFDHSGGLRAAVAEGATIVTRAPNQAYFERAFATPNRIAPDRLAASGRKASFQAVDDKRVLTDGTRQVELYAIADSIHSNAFLLVYLPKERLLVQADAFTPGAPNTPPPATPNANHVNLITNLERLKLSVDRILPLHGRIVPLADLYTAAGATPPKAP